MGKNAGSSMRMCSKSGIEKNDEINRLTDPSEFKHRQTSKIQNIGVGITGIGTVKNGGPQASSQDLSLSAGQGSPNQSDNPKSLAASLGIIIYDTRWWDRQYDQWQRGKGRKPGQHPDPKCLWNSEPDLFDWDEYKEE